MNEEQQAYRTCLRLIYIGGVIFMLGIATGMGLMALTFSQMN